ncbi:MAG TPA: glutamate--tRNA ligase [Solirubrobacteraceae bacterium]|jgi:glutamyl-tRNA synthetase|nr:glutamate--tRNA ligase [Solirubrobacteraceae bacterium]
MRVRFAPSPTGALHIGGARTALFNWLLARGSGGALVLRIEDTDRERSTPENVHQIVDALRWLELDWDEGPIFQSERAERHREALGRLLADGHAYRSTATAQDVKEYKRLHGAERGFRGEGRAGNQKDGAVRLRVPDEGATVVHDAIRGDTRFEHIHLDDPVIARGDGSVLYNFAVAVDDLDAGITHVVRGEDHLSNTPKQLLVLEALKAAGIAPEAALPLYAHLPLLHGPDGKKLSKRHGAASVQELRAAGYLPAAVRNYLALLGWGAGDDATILSTEQLIERFALERVSRNPARFDEAKLRWMNGVHIRELPPAMLAGEIAGYLEIERPPHAHRLDPERLQRAVEISQEKIQVLSEFWPLARLFFEPPVAIDEQTRERWLDDKGRHTLAETRTRLEHLDTFDEPAVETALLDIQGDLECKPREIYQPLRVALSGTTVSPGIFETVSLLGREETLRRIDTALEHTHFSEDT